MDERAGHTGQGLGVDWGARVDAQNAGYTAHEMKCSMLPRPLFQLSID